MSSSLPVQMSSLERTYGALLIGAVAAAILYGFTCMQTWYYYVHYPSDSWRLKLLVFAALVSDTLHQVVISHAIYIYLITYIGQYENLLSVTWSMNVEVLFNALTTLMTQCFLVVRIYSLSNKNWSLTAPALAFVMAQFIMSMALFSKSVTLKTWPEFTVLKGAAKAVSGTAAGVDILIAVTLCALQKRSRTGSARSNALINKLIIFSVHTGLLASILALASLICLSVSQDTFAYIGLYFCTGRLYCNSMLTTLNARKEFRDRSVHDFEEMSISRQLKTDEPRDVFGASLPVPNNISVKIDSARDLVREEGSSSVDDLNRIEVI